MNKLLDQAPKIIEEAAKSPLGLLALIIMSLSVLALLFFRKVSTRIRIRIFLVVFFGFLLLGWELYRVGTAERTSHISPRPPQRHKVVKLDGLLEPPRDVAHLSEWYPTMLRELFEAKIIIDTGSLDGTKQGDYFVIVQEETEIRSNDGEMLGVIQDEGSLLQAVEVHPNFSICQVKELPIESSVRGLTTRLKRVSKDRETVAPDIVLAKYRELFVPVIVGQEVTPIARDEKARWNEVNEAYNQAFDEATGEQEKVIRYADTIKKANAFLLEHADGHFAPAVMYRKGLAQFQLKQYQDSINTFKLFLERYPFAPSAKSVEESIEKSKSAMRKSRK